MIKTEAEAEADLHACIHACIHACRHAYIHKHRTRPRRQSHCQCQNQTDPSMHETYVRTNVGTKSWLCNVTKKKRGRNKTSYLKTSKLCLPGILSPDNWACRFFNNRTSYTLSVGSWFFCHPFSWQGQKISLTKTTSHKKSDNWMSSSPSPSLAQLADYGLGLYVPTCLEPSD